MTTPANKIDLNAFVERVYRFGKEHYRDLPWRNIDDPYAVLVSEVMLQQTQVKRVLDYWSRFISLFPTADALASAETSLVLEMWQGLGYNRRALLLQQSAQWSSEHFDGRFPDSIDNLIKFPGIGPATAAGIRMFAFNKPALYLETNVRSVFIHEFFESRIDVSDKEILPLLEATAIQADMRKWGYALLDYGAYLKKAFPNPSRRSKHYAKQSTFEGSRRQKRAGLLRIVLATPGLSYPELHEQLNREEVASRRDQVSKKEFDEIVDSLIREGFFREDRGTFYV